MSDQEPTGKFAGDELGVLDLWHALRRRRMWVYVTLLAFICAGIGYMLLKRPTYEASATLRIGQVAGVGPFEPAEVLASRLLAQHGEEVADGVKRARPFLYRAAVKRGVPATIDLVTVGDSPDDAAGLLMRVLDAIRQSHAEHYRAGVQSLNDRLEALESQRRALLRQSEQAGALLTRLQDRDAVQASLVVFELGRLSSLLASVEAAKPEVMQRLGPPLTQPTELLREVVAPTEPAAPKRLRVAAVAFALGLIGGVTLAFLAEFAARAGRSSK